MHTNNDRMDGLLRSNASPLRNKLVNSRIRGIALRLDLAFGAGRILRDDRIEQDDHHDQHHDGHKNIAHASSPPYR
jgi:hypothetical protein